MKTYIIELTVETELDEDDSFVELHDRIIEALGRVIDVNNFGIDIKAI